MVNQHPDGNSSSSFNGQKTSFQVEPAMPTDPKDVCKRSSDSSDQLPSRSALQEYNQYSSAWKTEGNVSNPKAVRSVPLGKAKPLAAGTTIKCRIGKNIFTQKEPLKNLLLGGHVALHDPPGRPWCLSCSPRTLTRRLLSQQQLRHCDDMAPPFWFGCWRAKEPK